MPRLPGPPADRLNVQAVRPVQSYRGGVAEAGAADAAGRVAHTFGQLGHLAYRVGEENMRYRDQQEYAQAKSAFLVAKTKADSAFDDDPEWGTWETRYRESLGQTQAGLLPNIQSERVRAIFASEANGLLEHGAQTQRDKARGRY